MLERDANRKYFKELFGALAIYTVVLFGSLKFESSLTPGALRTALLLSPAIPIGLAIWAIARHFRRMDEFVRLRSLEMLSIAAAVTAGLSLTYGFMENAGFPRLSMFVVWPVMGGVWATLACVDRLLRR
jgi:hypothetical protein